MDIHDLKIFLRSHRKAVFPETRTGMAAKDSLRRDYTIRKKLISSNEKLRVSHKLYRMHEKAEYSLWLFCRQFHGNR